MRWFFHIRFLFRLLNCIVLLGLSSACTNNKNKKTKLKINSSETFFNTLKGEPENLHPIRSIDYYSSLIQSYVLETLLQRDKDTYKWQPLLAKSWEVSPDGKIFTFELYENLKWSDGKPLTTQDVKFSFDAYTNPEYGGIRGIPYYENIDSAKILTRTKIQFKVKEPYFNNFEVIAGLMDIIPQHIYRDPKTKLSRTVIGSGPYKLTQFITGNKLVLQKNPLWAGRSHPHNQGKWNFNTIVFRIIKLETDILLRMEKQELDFSYLTAESFVEKTNHPPWGERIQKVKYQNKEASHFGYIGFNLKNPLFQDLRVRKALAHLLNRELMNERFKHGQAELARGPWYFWSEYADPEVKPIEFNPRKARALLKAAGWGDEDKNGVLEKIIEGRKTELDFTILFSRADNEKYLTLYKEDLKRTGIKLRIKRLDWPSFLRLINDRTFEAIMSGWSSKLIDVDPKPIWHSESSQKGGANRISYSNLKVDALIDKGRKQMDRKERIKIFRQVYRLIAEDVPYIFLFNYRTKFYGVNSRIARPVDTFNYDEGLAYWNFKDKP